MTRMRKIIKVYEDGKQFLVEGDLDMELNGHGVANEYEIDVKDEDFKEMMAKPDKVRISQIKNKRLIKRGKMEKSPRDRQV